MGSMQPSDKKSAFRQYLPDLTSDRFVTASKQNAYSYAEAFQTKQIPPWLYNLTKAWEKLLTEPYKGVTSDGNVRPGLFKTQNEDVPINDIVSAVQKVYQLLPQDQQQKLTYPINGREWRSWSNPEFLLRPFGLRLEEMPQDVRDAILSVIKASFSPEGYQKALTAMQVNHFLGELCKVPKIMNEYSYNFLVFGTPSPTESWGWSLYGHHLCLNVFFKGSQMVISPTFTGAEPNLIDAGPCAGSQILAKEGDLGLQLMQSLPKTKQEKAQIFKLMHDPGMLQTGDLTVDRWNKDDQRHVCGAFRDNRVVPYEGVLVSEMTPEQQQLILAMAEEFLLYLPTKSRQMRLATIKEHFAETYFCWIGGYGDEDAFYYRIQSPVVVCEFDHHSGVFLTNQEPAKFHTHTIVRTPNAGDYGNAIREPSERL